MTMNGQLIQEITYLAVSLAVERFEFFDMFGNQLVGPHGAVRARERATGRKVPVRRVVVHPQHPVTDCGDQLIVVSVSLPVVRPAEHVDDVDRAEVVAADASEDRLRGEAKAVCARLFGHLDPASSNRSHHFEARVEEEVLAALTRVAGDR